MKQLFYFLVALLTLSGISSAPAQPFAIGNWREHMPYLQGKAVAVAGDRVYCATQDGLFAFNKQDQSLKRYSKLNGLNDFGVRTIAYSSSNKVLVIVYNNTNIDLLFDDGRVLNLSDIKRKNIPGNKIVNRISIEGDLAYLSCGFGVVVLDLLRREIKDTYYISAANTGSDVNDVVMDGSFLYAAAEDGIYQATLTDPFINNYSAWTKIISDTNDQGGFNQSVLFNGVLFFNYNRSSGDSLMGYNGNWGYPLPLVMQGTPPKLSLRVENNLMFLTESSGLSVFDASLNRIRYIDGSVVTGPDFSDGVEDASGNAWIADKSRGLLKVTGSLYEKMQPEGPNSSLSSAMQVVDGQLWVAHGPRNKGWQNAYRLDGFSVFNGADWITYDGYSSQTPFIGQYTFYDNMSLVVDPSDKNHLFIGSGGAGLLEVKNGAAIKFYRDTNSTLLQQFGNPGQVKVHGLVLDDEFNLWCSNAGVNSVINVRKNDGNWKRFLFPGKINSSAKTGDMVMDLNGYLWMIVYENIGGKDGILVFNPNRTIDNTADDQFDLVDFGSNRVRCLAKDKDGTIWTGSDVGVYVFYPPSITPQQILIRQDNSYQYLLAGEVVTAIAVDGANRKWVGTENGGIYLFSPDGQEQIHHFTFDNSPLFSNNISSIAIDAKNGEVFIGTDKGLMSYQSDAVEASADIVGCNDILVYPNPVERTYDGPVAIKGVVPNGIVKITDVNGGLVYQTTALGTQAIWNGRNLQGEEVSTGVYIVFSSDPASENTCVTKLMYFR